MPSAPSQPLGKYDTRAAAAASLAAFVLCSCVMMPLNRATINALPGMPLAIIATQMGFAAVALLLTMPADEEGTIRELRLWSLWASPTFVAVLGTSMFALKHCSFGLLTTVRNLGPLLTLPLEHAFIERQRVGAGAVASLGIVAASCAAYVYSETVVTPAGLAWASVNTACCVADRLVQRKLTKDLSLGRNAMLLMNNLIGCAAMMTASSALREPFARTVRNADALALLLWLSSAAVGLCLGYAGLCAQAHVSATTHMLVSNVNKMVVVAAGVLVFGDASSWQTWASVSASVAGAVCFARTR